MSRFCEGCKEYIMDGEDFVFTSNNSQYMHEECFASYLIEGINEALSKS